MFFAWIDDTQWVLDQDALLNTEGLDIQISPTKKKASGQAKLPGFETMETMGETQLAGTTLSFTDREKTTVLQALNYFVIALSDDDDRRQLISDVEKRIEILGVKRPTNEL